MTDHQIFTRNFSNLTGYRREPVDLADAPSLSQETVQQTEVAAGDPNDELSERRPQPRHDPVKAGLLLTTGTNELNLGSGIISRDMMIYFRLAYKEPSLFGPA